MATDKYTPLNSDSLSRFEDRFNRLLNTLERDYKRMRPEFGEDGFRRRVFDRISTQLRTDYERLLNQDDKVDPQRLGDFVGEIEYAQAPVGMDVWFIHAACAYMLAGELAYQKNEIERAWDFIVDAAFHAGWIYSVGLGPDIYDHLVLKNVRAEMGRNAAKGRHKETDAMKDAAYAFVKECGGFPSQARAVVAIEGMLRERFPSSKPLKSPQETIEGWLKSMPEREKYFETLTRNQK